MPIKLEVITAERVVFSDTVDSVTLPGVEGELGVLPHHTPLMTLLHVGELRARKGSDEIYMTINGGFLEVLPDRIILLTDTAERAEEIDEARAEAARQGAVEALARGGEAGVDTLQALATLRRSMLRLKVAQRKRRREGPR